MEVKTVYDDGSILTPEVFKMSPDDILAKFANGVKNLASLSLAVGEINELSVPHMLLNGFKNLACISLEADVKVKQLGALTAAPAKTEKKDEKTVEKKVEKVEEKKPEETEQNLGNMFGDDY